MSFFGLSQRSPDCNGDVIAWAEVPEIDAERSVFLPRTEGGGVPWPAPADWAPKVVYKNNAQALRDCWWEGGMAG